VDTENWVEVGLYEPDAPGAGERRALLEYLTARGATIEQMVEAHRLGGLPGLAGDLAVGTSPPMISLVEVAARSGVPVERVQRVLLAAGVPVAADSLLPDDLDSLLEAFEQGALVMGEDGIIAFTRVLGSAATNVAEAAVALFYAEVGPGTERQGSDELARARIAEMARLAFVPVPEVLSRLLLVQFDRAARRALLARGWSEPAGAPAGGQNRAGGASGPGEVVALGFVDLIGSTSWAERLSLRDQSLALSRFESAAWSSAVLADGRVVKMIGDEVFFAAPSVDAACRIGVEICQAVAEDPRLPPARGSVGFGPVTPREGDYFGPLVNLVARLVKAAAPGAVVVTEEAAAQLTADRWLVEELGTQQPRGLEHPVRLFGVSPAAPPRG
jgi:adenylate cyclase